MHEAVDVEGLSDSVLALNRAVVHTSGPMETLQHIAGIAGSGFPGGGAGLTLRSPGRTGVVTFAGEPAEGLDDAQDQDGTGPSLDAYDTGRPVFVDWIPYRLTQWPLFAARCGTVGVVSSLSLPLLLDQECIGVLTLYGGARETFTPTVRRFAEILSAHVAVAATNAATYWSAIELTADLERALQSRDLIGQAKGVLMTQRHITSERAFDLLRISSQLHNVKLHTIAQQVVDTGEIPPSTD